MRFILRANPHTRILYTDLDYDLLVLLAYKTTDEGDTSQWSMKNKGDKKEEGEEKEGRRNVFLVSTFKIIIKKNFIMVHTPNSNHLN